MGEPAETRGMSEIVQTVARLLRGFILLFGIYLIGYGHVTPGGGFAGGTVIACSFVLMTLAGGAEEAQGFFDRRVASTLDAAGVLSFVLLAAIGGWWAGGAFFTNAIETSAAARFTLASGGLIPLANVALGIKVASSLFVVFTVLAALRIAPARPAPPEDGA
ncbi:MAG: MnhB domain-containing protein [Gammaproteobacteria bacterium]